MSDAFDPQIALDRVRAKVRSVPDFPKPGILFRDITPVLADPPTLVAALALHRRQIGDIEGSIDKIVGIESRGFLFGMALAAELHVGFVPVRKPGKLPAATTTIRYALEYGSDTLQIHTDAIEPGPAIIGIAIGKTEMSSCSRFGAPAATSCARFSRRWVRVSNTMSIAIRNSMMPPASRNASRLIPSARSSGSPNIAKNSSTPVAISVDRHAIVRRCAADVPSVRLPKIGAHPGGSITTKKVMNAETNSSSITAPNHQRTRLAHRSEIRPDQGPSSRRKPGPRKSVSRGSRLAPG